MNRMNKANEFMVGVIFLVIAYLVFVRVAEITKEVRKSYKPFSPDVSFDICEEELLNGEDCGAFSH